MRQFLVPAYVFDELLKTCVSDKMSSGGKPATGISGIKYGLQLPKAPPKQPPKVAAIQALFSIDDDNETEIKDIRKVMLDAQKAQSARMVQVRSPSLLTSLSVACRIDIFISACRFVFRFSSL